MVFTKDPRSQNRACTKIEHKMVEMIFKIPVLVNKEIQQNIECEKFKIYDILFLNFAALNFLIRKIKIRLWIWKNFSVIPYPISTIYPACSWYRENCSEFITSPTSQMRPLFLPQTQSNSSRTNFCQWQWKNLCLSYLDDNDWVVL